MKLTEIVIAGFRGVRSEIRVPVDDGFLVITGRNGSGKSTLCDAIEFGMTGTLSKFGDSSEKSESVADYLWWRGEGAPSRRLVELTFRREDGTVYKIAKGPDAPVDGSGEIEAFCLPGSDKSFSDVTSTIFLRDETIAALSLDLAETDRYAAVERALGVAIDSREDSMLHQATDVAGKRLAAAEREVQQLRERVLSKTEELARRRAEAVAKAALVSAQQTIEQEIPGSLDDLARVQAHVVDWRNLGKVVEADYQALVETERHAVDLQRQQDVLSATDANGTQPSTKAVDVLELQRRLHTTSEELVRSSEKLRRAGSRMQLANIGKELGLIEGRCPLCDSRVSDEQFDRSLRTILDARSADEAAHATLVSQQAELVAEIERLTAAVRRREQLVEGIRSAIAMNRDERKRLDDRICRKTSLPSVTPESLRVWLAELAAKIERVESSISVLVTAKRIERLGDVERELDDIRNEEDLAAGRVARLQAAEESLKALTRTVKQVTKEIADERLQSAFPLLTEFYRRLRPHGEWRDVSYRVRGDIRKFLSFRVGVDINPKFVFSSGQRRAAGIAFLLAVHMARNWCRLNTLVLDDPVQHIDDFRALHLVEVLSAIRKTGKQIICSVEDPALADLIVRRLQVAPLEGGARLELRHDAEKGVVMESHRRVFALPQHVLESA